MLVLTRKQNEQIRIGDDITITVIRTKGKAVRLGISAPSDISVLRGELVFDTAEEPESEAKISTQGADKSKAVTQKTLSPVAEGSPFANVQPSTREDYRKSATPWSGGDSTRSGEESALGTATVSAITMRGLLDARVGV